MVDHVSTETALFNSISEAMNDYPGFKTVECRRMDPISTARWDDRDPASCKDHIYIDGKPLGLFSSRSTVSTASEWKASR